MLGTWAEGHFLRTYYSYCSVHRFGPLVQNSTQKNDHVGTRWRVRRESSRHKTVASSSEGFEHHDAIYELIGSFSLEWGLERNQNPTANGIIKRERRTARDQGMRRCALVHIAWIWDHVNFRFGHCFLVSFGHVNFRFGIVPKGREEKFTCCGRW